MSARLVLPPDALSRFMAKVSKDDMSGCWVWTASTDKRGYGEVRIKRRLFRAHRISYEIAKGPIPEGLILRHSCDNPPCVNPDHLEPGTQADNLRDCAERGRRVQVRGEQVATAKLTAADVREIRRIARTGATSQRSIARLYGVSHTMIQDIVNGRSWAHVTEERS